VKSLSDAAKDNRPAFREALAHAEHTRQDVEEARLALHLHSKLMPAELRIHTKAPLPIAQVATDAGLWPRFAERERTTSSRQSLHTMGPMIPDDK
jgi:hypothetical protein